MSEPDSLYLRVHLSKQAYERYLASPGADARDFPDWMDWLGKVQMHQPRLHARKDSGDRPGNRQSGGRHRRLDIE